MSIIEYQYTEGRRDVPIAVRVDGKIVGDIKPVWDKRVDLTQKQELNGWQYVPRGQKTGGKIFATLQACQDSLKEPEENKIEVEEEFLLNVARLCEKICNSTPETKIKGEIEALIEALAFHIGHHPEIGKRSGERWAIGGNSR